MRLIFLPTGWEHYLHWQQHDRKILVRLNEVLRDTVHNPFTGIGKPEPLRNNLKGWWSRRITQEHRLISKVENESIVILQCRFHYDT